MTTYIHYGANRFDPKRFKPIRNQEQFPKPRGGLWASDVDAPFGWSDWCEREHFCLDSLNESFRFHLTEDANIYRIESLEQLPQLPRVREPANDSWYVIDFEAVLAQGIDAIEISISKCPALYWELYGWDCDSILIMNKDVIVPEKEGRY